MTSLPATSLDDSVTLPRLPGWVTSMRAERPEDVAFLSGAALCHCQGAVARTEVPQALVRERLALLAAEACVGFSGRQESAGDLRDTRHFLRPGDLPGPAGESYSAWWRAVEHPVSVKALGRALPAVAPELLAGWLDAERGGAPLARAAAVLEKVLSEAPRAETPAVILAEAALAQALGWRHVWPVLALGLRSGDLRKRDEELRLACHRAAHAGVARALPVTEELTRRAARLRLVAPKLRAKAAGAAVELFLTRDALAPGALPLPDRAARRLCDRLVSLDALRELTGRDSFRLYGV